MRGSALDLLGTLRDVGAAPAEARSLSPVFFHRTLARWLGLPEGRPAHGEVIDGERWAFRLWRADLTRDPSRDVGPRLAYAAALREGADDDVDTVVRWWVEKDADGRIVSAAWEGAEPALSLLGVDGDVVAEHAAVVDDDALARLAHDDD